MEILVRVKLLTKILCTRLHGMVKIAPNWTGAQGWATIGEVSQMAMKEKSIERGTRL